MIAFTCPTCKAKLQVHDSAAGTKVLCKRCSQKLLVPTPPRPDPKNKTVVGQLEGFQQDAPLALPVSIAVLPAIPVDQLPLRARLRANRPLLVVAAVTVTTFLGTAIILLTIIFYTPRDRGGDVADHHGQKKSPPDSTGSANSAKGDEPAPGEVGAAKGPPKGAVTEPATKVKGPDIVAPKVDPEKPATGEGGKTGTPADPEPAKKAEPASPKPPPDPILEGLKGDEGAKKVTLKKLAGDAELGRKYLTEVCKVMAEGSTEVRQSAVEVLQKTRPELVEPLITLIVDANIHNRQQAFAKFAVMGESAKVALPVLLQYAKKLREDVMSGGVGGASDSVLAEALKSLMQLDGQNPDVAQLLILSAETFYTYPFDGGGQPQLCGCSVAATKMLPQLATAEPKTKARAVAKLIDIVKQAQITTGKYDPYQKSEWCRQAIMALGAFGPSAKEALPVLQPLRFHANQAIRTAAEQAIKSIGS